MSPGTREEKRKIRKEKQRIGTALWFKNPAKKELINEYIKKRSKISFECECGSTYLGTSKIRHLKTIKHRNFIEGVERKVNEKERAIYLCECGTSCLSSSRLRHEARGYHKLLIAMKSS